MRRRGRRAIPTLVPNQRGSSIGWWPRVTPEGFSHPYRLLPSSTSGIKSLADIFASSLHHTNPRTSSPQHLLAPEHRRRRHRSSSRYSLLGSWILTLALTPGFLEGVSW